MFDEFEYENGYDNMYLYILLYVSMYARVQSSTAYRVLSTSGERESDSEREWGGGGGGEGGRVPEGGREAERVWRAQTLFERHRRSTPVRGSLLFARRNGQDCTGRLGPGTNRLRSPGVVPRRERFGRH